MDRSLAMLGIGLVFGAGLGFVFAAGSGTTLDGHDHGNPAQHGDPQAMVHNGHDHSEIIELTGLAPTLTIDVQPDPVSGWNLHVVTQNFRFAPERASMDHVPGEGHAHVHVNGVKVARLYGPWLHLASLPTGKVEISVGLYSNDHKVLSSKDHPIDQTLSITAP